MSRDELHRLVESIPEEELLTAQRFLEFLAVNPAYRAALSSPPDAEAITAEDEASLVKAQDDIRNGRVVSHDDVLSEFGLR